MRNLTNNSLFRKLKRPNEKCCLNDCKCYPRWERNVSHELCSLQRGCCSVHVKHFSLIPLMCLQFIRPLCINDRVGYEGIFEMMLYEILVSYSSNLEPIFPLKVVYEWSRKHGRLDFFNLTSVSSLHPSTFSLSPLHLSFLALLCLFSFLSTVWGFTLFI